MSGRPTLPEDVDENTPLSALNLNWRERDLPEKERTKHVHRLHPYLGKFIPQLVEIFLRKYFRPGDTVYDPFCGSGTALGVQPDKNRSQGHSALR
ncbi:MAG: DNA methyltransferase [Anaerolineae bacterium]